jgi:hypothetical protein
MNKKMHYGLSLGFILLCFIFSLHSSLSQNVIKYSIGGVIKNSAGAGISDVTVILAGGRGGRTTTDASGIYKFDSLPSGRFYTITPVKLRYTFDPVMKIIEDLNSNKTDINFIGTGLKYFSISGYIKDKNQAAISGVTLYLVGIGGGKITTDNSGYYKFDSLESGRYFVLTPYKKGYTFDPQYVNFNAITESKTQNFTGTSIQFYSISGYINDKDKNPISDAKMTLVSDRISYTLSESKGFYKFDSLESGKTYYLVPFKKRYTFDPQDMKFEKLSKDQTQDFKGTLIPYYSISGVIKDKNSNPIAGVTVGILGGKNKKVTTDNTGSYKFDSLNPGFYYLVVPAKRGYTFDPTEKSFENLNSDKVQNFTGNAVQLFSVSGIIKDNNSIPLQGVTVKLVGDKASYVLTDASGAYKFDSLEGKRPVIILPEKRGYNFTPKNAVFTGITENIVQNFTGTAAVFYSISGMVKDSNNEVIKGVVMILGGERHRVMRVDSVSGFYRFDSLEAGKTFVVFPIKRGFKFEPRVKLFEKISANNTQNFIGTRLSNENAASINGNISIPGTSEFSKSSGNELTNAAGITVYLMGEQNITQTTTDGNGFYTFDGLDPDQVYSIMPYKQGTEFYPASQSIDLSNEENQPDDILGTPYQATDIKVNNSALPVEIKLFNNYPNPFNPATNISFELPVSCYVSLKVYDILGKEVSVLLSELKPAGRYDIVFDGKNYSSGIYFAKLKAGSAVQTISMHLIK